MVAVGEHATDIHVHETDLRMDVDVTRPPNAPEGTSGIEGERGVALYCSHAQHQQRVDIHAACHAHNT